MQGNRLFSILLILVLLALPELGLAQEITVDSVYQVVFQDLTAVEASEALPNIGQTLHLLAVVFPDESATVSSLKVRIEAAFNEAGPWFPISPDITEAPLLGGIVYQMTAGYMPFPYVRVNSLQATPGGEEMTVYYFAHRRSPNTVIEEHSDRFIL